MEIYARECKIKSVSKNEYKSFTEINHAQGYVDAIDVFGLYYEEELVQLLALGKPRFNKNYQWEIVRDCAKIGCSVIGGVSKLWNYFINNRDVNSCICYSYPHDENKLYTDKYVKYCGFRNIKRAKPEKKIYFEGEWQGEYKRIDKSILERYGVDRLLNGSFGQDKSNEQILLGLGFEKKEEDGYAPQVDSYFPFGVVYKITDETTGQFYIGKCESKRNWDNGYMGSGTRWKNHMNANPEHFYKREIIRNNFDTPKSLYKAEEVEIRKYCEKIDNHWKVTNKYCLNILAYAQGTRPPCPECGSFALHKMSCSKYKPQKTCPECGGKNGSHYKICSFYKIAECEECGALGGHHKKSCSQFKKQINCSECGGKAGLHKKSCSKSKKCPECGYVLSSNRHAKTCKHYKQIKETNKICLECGGKRGNHKKTCSKYITSVCPECGRNHGHFKTCSKYKAPESCKECGRKYGHKKWCSQYKEHPCPECGNIRSHKKTCSKYIERKKCPECGGGSGNHFSTCSKYKPTKICSECGLKGGHHKKDCSYKKRY